MSKETVVGKAFDMKILRRIYAFTKPYKKKFYLSVGLTLLLAFLSPLRPILIQYTVDEYIIKLDEAGLGKMMLLMIALLLFQTYSYLSDKLVGSNSHKRSSGKIIPAHC